MAVMKLSSGDKVHLSFFPEHSKPWHEFVTIKGFSILGAYFEERDYLHFSSEAPWYAVGYHNNGMVIYTRYLWQVPVAQYFEHIRLGEGPKYTLITKTP